MTWSVWPPGGRRRTLATRGSALFMLLTVVGMLYIFGTLFVTYMTQERGQTIRQGDSIVAFYLAEAGIEKAMVKMRELFSEKLLTEDGEINDRILGLLDIDRAENFQLKVEIADGELIKGGKVEVLVEVNNLKLTPFKTYIDEYEEVPSQLKIYRKENRDTYADKALGGWDGHLRFVSTATYRRATKRLEVVRDLKVSDLTPPAENYTLFISGKRDEYLKEGEFRCRNWSVVRSLKDMIDEIIKKTNEAFQETLGNSAEALFWEPNTVSLINFEGDVKVKTLKVIRKLVMSVTDVKIKDYVDTTIQKLHPYLWGKIRTNGRLHVYLPFFAADDIINYFEDNSIFSHQRPEIGYLFCNNQLHDPYLSKYTYYEGEIIRYYQKLKPYVLGITETPYPSSDPYTINTKFDFVTRYPNKLEPLQLERIKKHGKEFCHEFYEGDLVLKGTYAKPASVWGIIYVQGNVYIGGRISGQGMIITEGNIILTDNVVHDSARSFLSLVALNGVVTFAPGLTKAKIEAAVYAKESIKGGQQVSILGNLVVENLNRQEKEDGPLIMPKRVFINYDSNLKSQTGNNVCFNVSEQLLSMRELGVD
ncbi:MAG: hypothetical protein OZSIB_0470 [Candidatus Ozemobacter sibiricus]|jgi:hypothetical protein|uniref:Uncharacterized protein n=1 Tax=Candidatus Ozemobacter sibiricus TaxID=2268124 RepID=A0A367ZMD6_9BACT|nr:MAG: hypothetical protein OZSIB_0470 [Candidatus Ozemobacter sibiricus]